MYRLQVAPFDRLERILLCLVGRTVLLGAKPSSVGYTRYKADALRRCRTDAAPNATALVRSRPVGFRGTRLLLRVGGRTWLGS
jgi:hypothetical protein